MLAWDFPSEEEKGDVVSNGCPEGGVVESLEAVHSHRVRTACRHSHRTERDCIDIPKFSL